LIRQTKEGRNVAGSRALLIANRHSRTGDADLSTVRKVLASHGLEVVERQCERSADIGDAIRRDCRTVDLVILGGGDGTMNAAVEALVECGLPLGILPTGTGNDLARTLDIPTDLEEAAAVIGAGRRHAIDLGWVNGKHFFNAASVGLSAEVTRHHTKERKRRYWVFAYVLSLLDAWRHTRPFRARLTCDGQRTRLRAIQVTVGNGRHYGGGMTVSENAAIDDGWLDVYCLRPRTFWHLMTLFPALRLGRLHRQEAALVMRCRMLEVRTRRPMPINTDGEITTRTPARFEVIRKAISVCVPATYQPAEEVMADAAQ
jgi:YegS/Rv2252/BmrU family lipid kinase